MSDFYPISPIVGITNTSYAAQAGVMDEKWAVRVLRGKKIIAEKTVHDLDLEAFVGVVYGHIRVEGLSRHAVAQCAGRMMQFARKYQQSGVAPNYEVPDLFRDGEDAASTFPETSTAATLEVRPAGPTEPAEPTVDTRIGRLPQLSPINPSGAWKNVVESQAALIGRMAAYGKSLPDGHLDLMFGQTADELVYIWSLAEDLANPVIRFAELILGCSKEGQIPKTGTNNVTLETGTCELLRKTVEMDPNGDRFPAGYPCKFHEMIAKRVGERAGGEIEINTSSTGCRVTLRLNL
ncbi:MAG: hypothetical protein RTU30_09395 [Candidatus Thorarchaeota archaeon]